MPLPRAARRYTLPSRSPKAERISASVMPREPVICRLRMRVGAPLSMWNVTVPSVPPSSRTSSGSTVASR